MASAEDPVSPEDIVCTAHDTLYYVVKGDGLPELKTRGASTPHTPVLLNSWQEGKILVIVSTKSGGEKAAEFSKTVLHLLSVFSKHVDVFTTTSTSSITELVQSTILSRAKEGIKQLVILLSGDGGVADIVDALYQNASSITPPTIAILPLGSGNALANSTLIARDNTLGLATLAQGHAKPLPVFKVVLPAGTFAVDGEGQAVSSPGGAVTVYGAVVASWALHSTLVAESDAPDYRKHGSQRFQMAAKELLFPAEGKTHRFEGRVTYTSGGKELEAGDQHSYVLVTLVSHLEATFCVSPKSTPLSGQLRLVRIGAMDGAELMEIVSKGYAGGGHVEDDRVLYEEVDEVKVHISEEEEKWRRLCVDGRIFVVPTNGTVSVSKDERHLLDLVVPQAG